MTTSSNTPDTPEPEPFRADFTESTITVYYVCDNAIATAAVASQTLNVPAFKPNSLHTWIQASFTSAIRTYRMQQVPSDRNVIALLITREGWEQALKWNDTRTSRITPYVRCRSDPEFGIDGEPLTRHSLQVSLSPAAVEKGLFMGWIVRVEDMTDVVKKVVEMADGGRPEDATALLPIELPYEFLDENRPEAGGSET